MQNETIRNWRTLNPNFRLFKQEGITVIYTRERKNLKLLLPSSDWVQTFDTRTSKMDHEVYTDNQRRRTSLSLSLSLNVRTKICKSSGHRTEFGFRNKCLLECVWQPIFRFHKLWSAADPLPTRSTSPHSKSLLNPRPQKRWMGALDWFGLAVLIWKEHKPSETLTAALIRCFTRLFVCDTTCCWKEPPQATDCWWSRIDSETKRYGRTCNTVIWVDPARKAKNTPRRMMNSTRRQFPDRCCPMDVSVSKTLRGILISVPVPSFFSIFNSEKNGDESLTGRG